MNYLNSHGLRSQFLHRSTLACLLVFLFLFLVLFRGLPRSFAARTNPTVIPDPPASSIQFSSGEYFISEGAGHIDLTVIRNGDVSGSATVNYATVDGGATQKSDYEIALGKLTFNPGETSKTFRVLIVDDNQIGGGSSVNLTLVLSNPTGAALVSPSEATFSIMDDDFDTQRQPANIIDDAQFFVRQHYFDFLNREPDPAGFNFWTNQIISCGTDPQCIELKRINVSAAFFLSIEFQSTGMLAYLTEKVAFGGLPRYGPFMRDVQALQKDYVFGMPGAGAQLETNKQAFFDEFVTRPEFVAKYAGLSQLLDLSRGMFYVDVHTTNFPNGEIRGQLPRNLFVPDMIFRSLDAGIITRAQALRLVAESDYFRMKEFNRAFVLLEYFGYLRRNPDDPPDNNLDGFNFWLTKLNQFNGNFVQAEMVKAFIKSTEYRGRFGPP